MPLLILPAAGLALTLGIGAGWLLRGRRRSTGSDADWKTRLAARDRDLYDARMEVAELTVALQSTASDAPAPEGSDDVEQTPADDLAERLRSAEAELADARNLEPGDAGTGAPDLLHRIEELEAELTTIASHRCPDPGAHVSENLMTSARTRGAARSTDTPTPIEAPEPSPVVEETASDDLTRITGIGVGLAKVFRSMGISTFGQVAAMDEATMNRLDDLVGGIRDRSMRHDWAGAALALQVEGTVAAS